VVSRNGKSRKNKIENLQLRLIEIEQEIRKPVKDDPFSFMTHGRRRLEHERDTIRLQLSFLRDEEEKEKNRQSLAGKRPRPTKQEAIHKKITAMRKRRPNASLTQLFDNLAEQMDLDNTDRVKKSYYDYEAKLKRQRDAKARKKRDSEGNATTENKGGK
jgi:hypothetical protein